MKGFRLSLLLTLLTAALVVGLSPRTVHAREALTVKIQPHATLLEAGQAVEVTVKVACDAASGTVLEAFMYVVQDGNQSSFAALPVVCDGKQRLSRVRVAMFPDSPPFQRGPALASAYILLLDPATGATVSGGDTGAIKIR
jgi:hypothetical protein